MEISPFEAATRWKKIQEFTSKIIDPVLKESILSEYQQRAVKEWGFCPDTRKYKQVKVELEPWQEAFLKKIKSAVEYGVFVVDEQVEKEARARMKQFIEQGNKFSDLPQDLQTTSMCQLYFDVLLNEIKYWKEQLDFLGKNKKSCLQGDDSFV